MSQQRSIVHRFFLLLYKSHRKISLKIDPIVKTNTKILEKLSILYTQKYMSQQRSSVQHLFQPNVQVIEKNDFRKSCLISKN